MDTDARLEHALSLLRAGDFELALTEFRKLSEDAREADPKTDYLYGELLALTRLGRATEARGLLDVFRRSVGDVDESHARADLVEVQLDVLEEKWHQALSLLQKMMERYGEMLLNPQLRDVYEEVQWRRGMLLAAYGKFQEGLPLLQESLSFESLVTGDLYFQLGRCYLDARDYEHARESFAKALETGLDDPSASIAHFNLGTILMRDQAYARAVEELSIAESYANRAVVPNPYIYKALAVSYGKLGMHKQAKHYAILAGVPLTSGCPEH
jgi:tetratricopeptide (TPR) repeat protein